MKKALYILIPLIIALAIRLYPTLISGMPFSVDGWPQIRQTELLLQNTPTSIDNPIFDGYNNFWPLASIFGALLSQITTLPPITAMAIGIPAVAALTIPIFYTLVKKITQNNKISLMSSALLATAFPYALFTAGVTKETFASPIYIALILAFLLKHNWKTVFVFSIASIALVLTHHLTAFLTVGILASISIALHLSKNMKKNSTKSNLLFTAILAVSTALYLLVFASKPLGYNTTPSDLLTVGAYQIITIAAVSYTIINSKKEKTKRRIIFQSGTVMLAVLTLLLVASKTPLMPTAPLLPSYYLLFSLPFIIAIPLISIGSAKLHTRKPALLVPSFWFLPIIAFASYGLFSNETSGISFAVRSINFMLPPITILMAIGIYKLYQSTNYPKISKIKKIFVAILIVSIGTINVSTLYATVSMQEPYLGYFWRYDPSDYQAAHWLKTTLNNQTVAGDSKTYYLLSEYFDKKVSISQGLNYLSGDGSPPEIIYVYTCMYKNGYVLYQGIPVTLAENWTEKIASYNFIYANSEVAIYAKR